MAALVTTIAAPVVTPAERHRKRLRSSRSTRAETLLSVRTIRPPDAKLIGVPADDGRTYASPISTCARRNARYGGGGPPPGGPGGAGGPPPHPLPPARAARGVV